MKKNIFLILFILAFFQKYGLSQSSDSLVRINAPYFKELKYQDSITVVNAKLNNFEKYRTYFFGTEFQTLGVTGNITKPLFWKLETNDFNYSYHNFESLIYQEKDVDFYQLASPYSDLNYVSMGKNDNIVRARYARNIYKGLNFALNFRVISNEGAYLRQEVENRNFNISLNYKRKASRYAMETFGIYNKLKINQNGGIAVDTIFEKNIEENRKNYAVNLKNATNTLKQYQFKTEHYFRFGSRDSNATHGKFIDELFRIGGGIAHYKSNFKYESVKNNLDTFYTNIYNDTLKTNDSSWFEQSSAFISIKTPWFENKNSRLISAYVTATYITAFYLPVKKESNDFTYSKINFGIYTNVYKTISGYSEFEYKIGDYYEGDYKAELGIRYNLSLDKNKEAWLKASYTLNEFESPYYLRYYKSNHFEWDSDSTIAKQKHRVTALYGRVFGFDFNIKYNILDKYFYFNEKSLPVQSKQKTFITQASIQRHLKFTKWLMSDFDLSYQKLSGKDSLKIPEIIAWASVYTNFHMFKKAILLQVGFDVSYYSAYNAPAYMPSTSVFYYQDKKSIGNYPYLDVFVNAKIQKATFFAKIEHVNKGFMGYNYYNTPHYPGRDRIFKFGINWRFFD